MIRRCFSLFLFVIAVMSGSLSALLFSGNASAETRIIPQNNQQILLSYSSIVKKTAPAVVNIYTQKKVKIRSFSPFLNDPFFNQFFGDSFGGSFNRERVEQSLGSGVIVDEEGFIMTNHHVVKDSDQITVALFDKSEHEATVVLSDEKTDLALLKIETGGESLPYLELYDSDQVEVGDLVLAIGNPFGVGQTVTSGIVSALARTTVGISDYQFFIQTDAAINPGNSGGALVNMKGKLVGINTAIFSRSGGSNGIGFATPSNMVRTIMNSRDNGGKIIRPWLGVSMQEVTADIANSIGLKRPVGALVSRVYDNSPADEAGLQVGDIIIKLATIEVENPHALQFRMATYQIGDRIPMTILRKGNEKTIQVKASPPMEIPPRDLRLLQGNHLLSGAKIANISPVIADELDISVIEKGVIITGMERRSLAARFGFQLKDIILTVNEQAIISTEQLENYLNASVKNSSVKGWVVELKRGNKVLKIIISK